MIKFEKVSFEQFEKDCKKIFIDLYDEEDLKTIYENIKLPQRATSGSAGYDFYMPFNDLGVNSLMDITIPTGIKVIMDKDVVLQIYPRSGLGFKYGIELKNTVGVIDSDYSQAENEGHIMIKLVNKDLSNDIERFAYCIINTDSRDNIEQRAKAIADYLNIINRVEFEQGKAFCQGVFMNYLVTDDDNSTKQRQGGMGSTDTQNTAYKAE